MDGLLRQGEERIPLYVNPVFFTFKVHHGGFFIHDKGSKCYVGGEVSYSDYQDKDKVSLLDLDEIGKKVGFTEAVEFYYKVPCTGVFKIIKNDDDILDMVKCIKDRKLDIFFVIPDCSLDDLEAVNWEWDSGTVPVSGITIEDGNMVEGLAGCLDEGVGDDSDSDVNYEHFSDSDYGMSEEDDMLYSQNVDSNSECFRFKTKDPSPTNTDEGHDVMYDEEDEGEDSDSDGGFSSLDEEEGDEPSLNKSVVFRPLRGREDPIFCNGMIFKSRRQLADAIRQHAILQGKDITFLKNETGRVRAKCCYKKYTPEEQKQGKVGCPWELSASDKGKAKKTLQIKVYNPNHNCGRIWHNKLMNCSFVAKMFFDDIRITPSLKVSELMEKCREQLKCKVSQSQCYRAKHKVLRKIEGSEEEQYAKLWDYCQEMVRSNPGTSVYIHLKPDQDGSPTNTFQRLYICWEALKRGFIEGCRPIVGVDGCHLKGACPGQLLTAVGIDANNQIFPVAYAVVEIEDTSTWTWFLQYLIEEIQIANEPTWTIISDKQKGLENAIQQLLPAIEHRHCVRHLHNNFKSAGFGGQSLKEKMWNLARASYVGRFNALMEELEKEDPGAHGWLSHPSRNPCHWSRSHFIVIPKCDILLNNLCEPFNKAILFARDKPILTMLERLRLYLMERLVKRRAFVDTWVDDLGPKIHKKIEKVKQRFGDYYIVPCNNGEFEVRGVHGSQHTVNEPMQSCSCRRWDLTGIPCEHGTVVIAENGGEPEAYVSDWYHKNSFITSYMHLMHPMNGCEMWEKSGKPPIKPPEFKKQTGRPRKSRRREADEPPKNPFKLSKVGVKMTCRRCGKQGHNTRTCKAPVNALSTTRLPPLHNTSKRINSNTATTSQGPPRKRNNSKTATTSQGPPRRTFRPSQMRSSFTQ